MSSSTQGGAGRWEDLNRDLLVAILARVGVADLVAAVPFVCSSWRGAAMDPACWRNLDFSNWDAISYHLGLRGLDGFPGFLEFVLSRTHGLLDSIYFPSFADEDDLLLVAERCPKLLYFSLPDPHLSADKFCEAVSKLHFLKGMAVDENLISYEVLLHVNQCCANFTELKVFTGYLDDEMASIISNSLPRLQKLEITNTNFTAQAIITFLDQLKELEHLDISGYQSSSITDVVLEKSSRLKVFLWDSRVELGEFVECSNCGDSWLLEKPCGCMLDQKIMEWLSNLS
ncbi:F-box/LRR-repeat protein At3g48880-like [Typha latifolia]|uniref:F-box/LRR-repeat protein At3g48880-like n=1 Tax=Typha latifolia TaxID=4733 RepID=UPI003C2BB576